MTGPGAGSDAEARRSLVEHGRRLLAEGLVARTWGNLSVRLDERTMLVTPSGIQYQDLTEAMIVPVDLETGEWTGDHKPTSERRVHREAYRRRPDVHAVVHTHQMAASICAAARVPVTAPFGEVPCAPYALPGTKQVMQVTIDALGDRPAALMANHGVLTVGASLDEAFDLAEELERTCATWVVDRRPREGSHPPAAPDAPWDPSCLEPLALADGTRAWLSGAPWTLRFSTLRRPLPAVIEDLAMLAGRRVDVARTVPKRRPRADAVLVPGRGALVCGDDHEAVAMVVEKAARAWIGGQGLGGAKPLPGWQALLMRAVYVRSYAKQAALGHAAA
ncbi:MAG: class II aldolase/adducin family protein [Candidatus Nanopelagicales bacterium]|nr:class II aldolase/adducin family protein [Candidatus Nanopelagicales bacterium]